MGNEWNVSKYENGGYLTIYLAPHNYHHIHSPVHGRVTKVVHIPGSLWPVNSWSVGNIDGLFICNERIIVHLLSDNGSLLLVMVGATNVGKITLNFNKEIYHNRNWLYQKYWKEELSIPKIAEACKVSKNTIWQLMKKFNIKRRSISESISGIKIQVMGKQAKKITIGKAEEW